MSAPKVLFTRDGSVAYVPPAPGDEIDAFVEANAAEFRKRGPRATLRGGLTLADLQRLENEKRRDVPPVSGTRQIKVLGIVIGGGK